MNPSSWIQTFTGRQFHPLAPRVEDLDIYDIAHALALTSRYNGHTLSYYSVAEHSVLVSRHVDPEYAREGLLHDAAEAYIGDMVRPLKRQPEMAAFVKAELDIERCVAEKFNLRTDPVTIAAWKSIDDRILVDEISVLMSNPVMQLERHQGKDPVGAEILCYTPERAEILFLTRFWELFPEHRPFGDIDFEIA
jgi:hypothetical protein